MKVRSLGRLPTHEGSSCVQGDRKGGRKEEEEGSKEGEEERKDRRKEEKSGRAEEREGRKLSYRLNNLY